MKQGCKGERGEGRDWRRSALDCHPPLCPLAATCFNRRVRIACWAPASSGCVFAAASPTESPSLSPEGLAPLPIMACPVALKTSPHSFILSNHSCIGVLQWTARMLCATLDLQDLSPPKYQHLGAQSLPSFRRRWILLITRRGNCASCNFMP